MKKKIHILSLFVIISLLASCLLPGLAAFAVDSAPAIPESSAASIPSEAPEAETAEKEMTEAETTESAVPATEPVTEPVFCTQEPTAVVTEETTSASSEVVYSPVSLSVIVGGYRISVLCGADAELPENAELSAALLSPSDNEYEAYVTDSAAAAGFSGADVGAAHVFDISLIDPDTGAELTPAAPVQVRIELSGFGMEEDNDVAVIHVAHEDENNGVSYDVLDASIEEDSIAFETDSFSVFVIIEGPSPVSSDLQIAHNVDELPGDGFFLSISKNNKTYYFRNFINAKNCIARTNDGEYASAAVWHFEPTGNTNEYYLYTVVDGMRLYMDVLPSTFMNLSETDKTAFTVSLFTNGVPDVFYIKVSGTASTGLNYSGSNDSFKCYGTKNNDCKVVLSYPPTNMSDIYHLNGAEYCILFHDGTSPNAYTLNHAAAAQSGCLTAFSVPVRTNPMNETETLFVAEDSEAEFWTFHSVGGDLYTVSVSAGGQSAYLSLSGTSLSTTDAELATVFRFVPGTDERAGKFKLVANGAALTYDRNKGAFTGSTAGSARDWMSFALPNGLTDTDFVNYTAQKVSVSDTVNLSNGSRVIVYTRIWNDFEKRYDFFVVDHDGRLFNAYERGDTIQWIGTQLNTAVWDFTEYYYEGTNIPNNYYELRNEYSGKFIAPQISGSVLSDNVIGLNMNGRVNGDYYTPILAWDDTYYAYSSLKVDNGYISSGYLSEAMDFYFALILHEEDMSPLDTVETLDHEQYGITMKLVNFGNRPEDIISVSGQVTDNQGHVHTSTNPTSREQYEVIGGSVYDQYRPTQGLLTTSLSDNGYPVATETGRNLLDLFGGGVTVNHLFDASIYRGSGYYEFNSTQNFATLTESGDFRVYKGLGTVDSSSKPSLKHGQFLPYNDISPEYMASVNPENLYSATLDELPNDDPRKYERLFLVRRPDYYFGMEIDASFVQTPSGRDRWGHDIIYEFTGDDDFWLYVDGELVIDLGGIHSAYPGKVNFCTGEVSVNGVNTTLRQIFRSNYAAREGLAENDPLVDAHLNGIFEQNDNGQYVFKDYSAHNMKIFFMERGGSASNLHMRFNLASVKEGQVLLSKELSGLQSDDYFMSEYGFQIYYSIPDDEDEEPSYHLLPPVWDGKATVSKLNSSVPIHYESSYSPSGSSLSYNNVFFLQAGETASIILPDDTIQYYVVECGVNNEVYDVVTANDGVLSGTSTADEMRRDYAIGAASMADRPQVVFNNHISENAVRTLTVTKRIFASDGVTPIADPDASFNFRLYLAAEGEENFSPANMKSYSVKDPNGYYCVWNAMDQAFAATSYSNWQLMPDTDKESATFHTSPNGAISKIPAGYHIEVRGLLVGTRFRVEERDYEIPAGYAFLRYERDADSYIVESGDTVNSGIIRAGQSPAIEVHNKQVWDLTVNKVWSDASYMNSHGSVVFAIYVNGALLPGTVRVLSHPDTSMLYRFESLEPGFSFSDYEVREVLLSGDYTVDEQGYVSGSCSVTPLEAGDNLSVPCRSRTDADNVLYSYTVGYAVGDPSGVVRNVRTDTVYNSRHGIRIVKTDAQGNSLQGAAFSLSDSNGDPVGDSQYVSDENGLVTIAYLAEDGNYTLTEIASPSGYQAMPEPLVFSASASGVTVVSGDSDWYTLVNDGEPCITVRDKPYTFAVMKIDANDRSPLPDAVFSLYAEVTVDGFTRMDYFPLVGFTGLTTDSSGVVPGIDETLAPGAYYLVETVAPAGYNLLSSPIRFFVSPTGVITLDVHDAAELNVEADSASCAYVLRVRNGTVSGGIAGLVFNLPATGGEGVGLFPVFALSAFAAAVVLLKTKRNKSPK